MGDTLTNLVLFVHANPVSVKGKIIVRNIKSALNKNLIIICTCIVGDKFFSFRYSLALKNGTKIFTPGFE